MISQGQWHQQVPKQYLPNLKFRRSALSNCKSASQRKAIWQACQEDILFWVNTFVWQFNPRKKEGGKTERLKVGPFITWSFQDDAILEMLWCIENDEDLLIEKSREMGASWLILIVFTWLILFHRWQKLLMISRNEKAVEDENPDSLFWKIDFIVKNTPGWLLPDGGMRRRKLFYGNDTLHSTMTGEATTGAAGVGGRATAMGIDEYSQIKEDYEVLHRTSDTTGCRIFNGTHLGLDTAFYELSQRVDMRKLKMHWTSHPDKNHGLYRFDPQTQRVQVLRYNDQTREVEPSPDGYDYGHDYRFVLDGSPTGGPWPGVRSPWYDKECKRKGSTRAIAMDLDIDPKGSVDQFFDVLMVRQLQEVYCLPPYWEGDVAWDKEAGRVKSLSARQGGWLKLWLNLKDDKPPPSDYVIGCDLSSGSGSTPSCLSIVNCANGEKVGEYTTPFIGPIEMAGLVCALAWFFKNNDQEGAQVIWEMQGPGGTFGQTLTKTHGYRNVFFRRNEHVLDGKISDQPGWSVTQESKLHLLEEYREGLHTRQFLNRSKLAMEECLSFKYDGKGFVVHSMQFGKRAEEDPSGSGVNHGDRVIADSLAWKLAKGKQQARKAEAKEEIPEGSLAWRRKLRQDTQREEQIWS